MCSISPRCVYVLYMYIHRESLILVSACQNVLSSQSIVFCFFLINFPSLSTLFIYKYVATYDFSQKVVSLTHPNTYT